MEPRSNPIVASGSRRQQLAEFLGLRRNLVVLLIAILCIGAGEELWIRFLPKYLKEVGATVFVIGLFDGLRTLLGAIYAYPGGVLVDRWGHRRAFITFNVISIAGYAIVLLVPDWGAVIAGMFLFLSWTCFSLPATFSLVAETLSANRYAMGIGIQSVIKRLPIMIAPIFGGVLIDHFGIIVGIRIGLAVSILLSGATIGAAKTGGRPQTGCGGDRSLEFLAQPARIQRAHAPAPVERHSRAFL
jgi:MFS family permease